MGHQVSAPLPVAVWTEALTAALNQSGAVWEMSPVGTVIETQVVRWMCALAGFGPDGRRHVHVRRNRGDLRGAARGPPGRAARRLAGGHGREPAGGRLRRARALRRGAGGRRTWHRHRQRSSWCRRATTAWMWRRWRPPSIRLRAGGRQVMAVVATAGTTPTGSFDDLEAIGRLVRGPRAVAARRRRARRVGAALAGASRAPGRHSPRALDRLGPAQDDAHAAHGQRRPREGRARSGSGVLAAGALPVPRRGGERNWDQGLRSFTCSRRIDAFKVWVAIQRYGAAGLGALVRSPVRDGPRALRRHPSRGRGSRRFTRPSRTSSASGTWATDRCPTTAWTR